MEDKTCIICGEEAKCEWDDPIQSFSYTCPNCGAYNVVHSFVPYLSSDKFFLKQKELVAGYLFETKDSRGNRIITLNQDEWTRILTQGIIPRTIQDKIGKLLSYVQKKTEHLGDEISLCPSVIYSNRTELYQLVVELSDKGLLKDDSTQGSSDVVITLDGVDYLKSQEVEVLSDKCFIAMWFAPEFGEVYKQVIEPACLHSGFNPIRVDNQDFNGDITDEIIGEIRTSRFVIADLSGSRGGVYYEAGFARGLTKEVILTCEEEWFNGDASKGKKVHFDVNHLNIIVWNKTNLNDFRIRLENRIKATVGMGPVTK